ncbi:MAG: mitochondrial fission ELM1 family protein [Pseudomonadota bacterium]
MNKIIWILSDDRPGNYSQAIGLAEKLAELSSFTIQIKKITYNSFARLPNFLKIDGIFGINLESKTTLLNLAATEQKPNIIIGAGRKIAPIAAFLKSYYQAFAIQIMNPNWNFAKFDLVVLPNHDRNYKSENIIRSNGSLTRIDKNLLTAEYQKFSDLLEKIAEPKIVLLVGGSSKKGKFTDQIAQNLGQIISAITKQMKGYLLVLNSRRTGVEITEILDQNLSCPKTFFKWQKNNWQNPYFAALQAADFIVATGDSISMCAEICSIGKPVYIFNPPEICSAKHLKFHQDLFAHNFAKKLTAKTKILENYSPQKLDETKRIAKLVLEKLSKKDCNNILRK